MEVNIFGLSSDYTNVITGTSVETAITDLEYQGGNYGKGALAYDGNGNIYYSGNGIYETNLSGNPQDEGSSKYVKYFNKESGLFNYVSAPGSFTYKEIRRGLTDLAYVPTEAELLAFESYQSGGLIDDGSGLFGNDAIADEYKFISSLPTQPHRIITRSKQSFGRNIGDKHYELSDHLGNVRYVIGDARIFEEVTETDGVFTVSTTDQQVMWSDYYPYGMYLDGRHKQNSEYRYGFNGMEKDDEVSGEGNSYTTTFRQYDARIGRWLSLDPVTHHQYSPYSAFDNNPIYFADPSGADSEGDPPKGADKLGDGVFTANTHTTSSGDTYSSLAKEYGVTESNLRIWNGYEDDKIPTGKELIVSAPQLTESGRLVIADRAARAAFDESGRKSGIHASFFSDVVYGFVLDEIGGLAATAGDVRAIAEWGEGLVDILITASWVYDEPGTTGNYDRMISNTVNSSVSIDAQAQLIKIRNAQIDYGRLIGRLTVDAFAVALGANAQSMQSASSIPTNRTFNYQPRFRGGTTYEIGDGVRRAYAHQLCGKQSINAFDSSGKQFRVPLSKLRSPMKNAIPNDARFKRVLEAVKNNTPLPPIHVGPGTRGVPINCILLK